MLWLTLSSVSIVWLANIKRHSSKREGIYYVILCALALRFLSYNLLVFYIMFEITIIPILLILVLWGGNPERLTATFYFVFYTTIISVPYFTAVALLRENLYFFSSVRLKVRAILILFILSPFLIKLPLFGLHFWLPKAHVEANTASSMLLAGILLKLGRYGIVRVIAVLTRYYKSRTILIMLLATLSSAVTIIQADIKKLIAYSRVSHITFILISVSFFTSLTNKIVIIGAISHGWISMVIFYIAGRTSHLKISRILLLYSIPLWLGLLFGVALMANAAIPLNLSFFTELLLVINGLMSRTLTLLPLIIIRMLICYYNVYLFILTTHLQERQSIKITIPIESKLIICLLLWNLISLWFFI